jgi:hypothetical protein
MVHHAASMEVIVHRAASELRSYGVDLNRIGIRKAVGLTKKGVLRQKQGRMEAETYAKSRVYRKIRFKHVPPPNWDASLVDTTIQLLKSPNCNVK